MIDAGTTVMHAESGLDDMISHEDFNYQGGTSKPM